MKHSDGFDARRLRPRNASNWRLRLGAGLAALFAAFGIMLSMAGIATLLGQPVALGPLNESPAAASVFVVIGLLLLTFGVLLWRRCRRRLRRPSDLSMAPHLMKKRD
ncbi:LPXTG cell wall anchor domain-containing protein [Pseudomonas peli]|uniref:LPXTG cell wall anchor domain-containing protein n=1 Tax=Pseudomonas peli TaxID=592361 RepID=UPI0024ADD065|nr:LPXTG cell wall anchor domain-containing protein [Pseudomonas peli]